MLIYTNRVDHTHDYNHTITLEYDLRKKARLKTKSDNGEEVGLMLPRGMVLRGGDCLKSDAGLIVMIIAAPEEVSVVTNSNKLLLAKACYHLGNRHMPLQIEDDYLAYQKDHVLDEMILSLGLVVTHVMRAFEPEPGAYLSHLTEHSHLHDHTNEHSH
jgi:urease accessory protein